MQQNNVKKFIEKVSVETVNGNYSWDDMTCFATIAEEPNSGLYYTIFENEWHKVDLSESFYSHIPPGTVYIVQETSESGYDGTVTDGYHLYVQFENDTSRMIQLPAKQSSILQLLEAVGLCINDDQNLSEAQRFIDTFFNLDNH